jgi:hypothetical protein
MGKREEDKEESGGTHHVLSPGFPCCLLVFPRATWMRRNIFLVVHHLTEKQTPLDTCRLLGACSRIPLITGVFIYEYIYLMRKKSETFE